MFKILIFVLFLLYVDHQSNAYYFIVNNDINVLYRDTALPVAAIIDTKKPKIDKIPNGYGSIIHPRAVLTAEKVIANRQLQNLQVWVNCYSDSDVNIDKIHCEFIRSVQEITIVEISTSNGEDILKSEGSNIIKYGILILVQPIELSDQLNIATLRHDDRTFNHFDCWLYSFRNFLSLENFNTSAFITPLKGYIDLDDGQFRLYVSNNSKLILNHRGVEQIPREQFRIEFMGSPVMCQLTGSNDYIQVAVSDLLLFNVINYRSMGSYFFYHQTALKFNFPHWFSNITEVLMII